MKIFLAGIIQGSLAEATIHDQDWRVPIKRIIARRLPEASVYCHYSHHPNSITYELPLICQTLAQGICEAALSDLVVAYVPSASMGTAVEIYEAFRHGAVVLTITPLAANWVLRAYSDRIFATVEQLDAFLASGELADLISQKRRTPASPGKP